MSSRPFPNWGIVGELLAGANANYESGQIEVSLRFGLTFNATYTLAKNLADNQGPNPGTAFAAEAFNGLAVMDAYDRRAGYGDVAATRRCRHPRIHFRHLTDNYMSGSSFHWRSAPLGRTLQKLPSNRLDFDYLEAELGGGIIAGVK